MIARPQGILGRKELSLPFLRRRGRPRPTPAA
jgi:hypothetical protein